MKIIGLTGGIASGKSTIAKFLRDLGAEIFDADEVSRNAVNKGSAGLAKVAEEFGAEYLTEDGEMNREKIAALVFADKEALKKLEAIIHKIVWSEAESFLQNCRDKNCKAAVLDVPLLIECGWHKKADEVWVVSVSRETQVVRAMARSGMAREDVEKRIAAQMSLADKVAYADLVIDNEGSLEATQEFVAEAWRKAVQT